MILICSAPPNPSSLGSAACLSKNLGGVRGGLNRRTDEQKKNGKRPELLPPKKKLLNYRDFCYYSFLAVLGSCGDHVDAGGDATA